jgi:Tfp pilus assembly protein PilF
MVSKQQLGTKASEAVQEFAWNELPYDLAAISAYNLQNFDLARSYGKIALDLQPNDKRLQNNYKHYLES